ncbi:MAG: hypothetical protein ABI361_06955 [Nitrososphaera sp.]|jgi:hypothetical protein
MMILKLIHSALQSVCLALVLSVILFGQSTLMNGRKDAYANEPSLTIAVHNTMLPTVFIIGNVSHLENSTTELPIDQVKIDVLYENGSLFKSEVVPLDTKSHQYSLSLDFTTNETISVEGTKALAPSGTYKIIATYGKQKAETTYELQETHSQPPGGSIPTYSLKVDGKMYTINYKVTSFNGNGSSTNSLNSISLSPQNRSMILSITSPFNGSIDLHLPRSLINSTSDSARYGNGNSSDSAFLVAEDGRPTHEFFDIAGPENLTRAHYIFGLNADPNFRDLEINYPAGTTQISITGTEVAPEFAEGLTIPFAGVAAAIILAISLIRRRYPKL